MLSTYLSTISPVVIFSESLTHRIHLQIYLPIWFNLDQYRFQLHASHYYPKTHRILNHLHISSDLIHTFFLLPIIQCIQPQKWICKLHIHAWDPLPSHPHTPHYQIHSMWFQRKWSCHDRFLLFNHSVTSNYLHRVRHLYTQNDQFLIVAPL